MNPHSSTDPNQVMLARGDSVEASNRVAEQALSSAARKITTAKSLLQRALTPVAQRQLENQLAQQAAAHTTELAILTLRECSDLRLKQIELDCQREEAAIRLKETQVVGDVQRIAAIDMKNAMGEYIQAEHRWQQTVDACNCSQQDRQLLSNLARELAKARTQNIAAQHNALPRVGQQEEAS